MKHRKLFGYMTLGLTVATLGAAFVNPISLSNLSLMTRAETVSSAMITFTGCTKSGTTTTSRATTSKGAPIICKITNNSTSVTTSNVGAVKEDSVISFYEADGVTEYTFEDLEIIRFYHGGTSFSFDLSGLYSDGRAVNISYSARTTSPRGVDFTGATFGPVSQLKVNVTSQTTTYLSKIEIQYSCSTKSISGVEVSANPTKMCYAAGETFDPSGMLVKAIYSNGTKVATNSYSYSPTTPLNVGDKVTVYFQGASTLLDISVTNVDITIAGTYNYISLDAIYSTLTLFDDGTGTYYRLSTTYYLTWSYNASSGLTLHKTSQSGVDPSYGQIFYDSDTITIPSSRITITNSVMMSLRIYVKSVSVALQTFSRPT